MHFINNNNFTFSGRLRFELDKYAEQVYSYKHYSNLRIFLEILIPFLLVTLTIQLFLKGPLSWMKFISFPIIFGFIFITQRKLKISLNLQGFKPAHWKKPVFFLLIPGILIGVGLFVYGLIIGSISDKYHPGLMLYITFIGYPIWGMVQQYVLLVYLLPRLYHFIKNPYTLIFVMALIFSTSHLPNPFLVILTFPVSILFLVYFIKYRNLYVQGYVHGFVGSIMKFCLPVDLTLKFWIGNLISWEAFINYF